MDTAAQKHNPETLDVVYQEAKDAFTRLMGDVDTLHAKADQQAQIGLLVAGIYTALGVSILSNPELTGLVIGFGISIVLVMVSVALSIHVKNWGDFWAGTYYPSLLQARLNEPPEQIKQDLVEAISCSYDHNLETLSGKNGRLKIAAIIEVGGIITPMLFVLFGAVLNLAVGA